MKALTHAEFIATLRAMADFYDSHPLAPIPLDFSYGWMRVYLHQDAARCKEILRSLGNFSKEYEDNEFVAKVLIGHITLDFVSARDKVCVKKVIGTKTVAEQVVPSSYTPEKVIPAHEEEIVEWDCQPVLAPEVLEAGQ